MTCPELPPETTREFYIEAVMPDDSRVQCSLPNVEHPTPDQTAAAWRTVCRMAHAFGFDAHRCPTEHGWRTVNRHGVFYVTARMLHRDRIAR
jgi:hypothetical protein